MSDNVGLSTPRGSGTSGYVQKNLSHLKPRKRVEPYPDYDTLKHRQREPNKDILEHERKREVEVKVFELRDRLEEAGKDEDDIDAECDALRKKLLSEGQGKDLKVDARRLKGHQVHEQAQAKIEESAKLRKAFGIREDYEEGSHWKKQEERLRDSLKNDKD